MIAVAKPKRRPARRLIKPQAEKPYRLTEIGKHLPDEPTYAQLWYWHERGLKNWATGEQIYLETIRLPRGQGTTVEAYWRFIEALNEG